MSISEADLINRQLRLYKSRDQGHEAFALHAAFPLALTPRLAYLIWANFQTDISNKPLGIQWVAVSDFLLSPFCTEVEPEIYELNSDTRLQLLDQLEADKRFGRARIIELSKFLSTFVNKELTNSNEHYKAIQRWAALAYVQPDELAKEFAKRFSELEQHEGMKAVRLASITEIFAKPLKDFSQLIGYAKYRALHARGNNKAAKHALAEYGLNPKEPVLGFRLPFYVLPDPPPPPPELPEKPIAPHTISIDRLQREGALTWLHLSDIHFGGPDPDGRPAVLNQLLKDIEERKAKDGISPDLIFITGDIAWSGKAEQYENMALFFLQELQFVTGVERDRIFLIPGNHDIDRSLVSNRSATLLAEDLLAEGSKENEKAISSFLYGSDAQDRKLLLKKHSAYISFVKKHFPHCAPLFDPCAYVTKVTVPDGLPFSKLWVLGLNSAWLSREGDVKGNLLLGHHQVQKALGFIEAEDSTENDFVFALTHHPLPWMTDWDERLCRQQLSQRTDFHLSGHLHEHAFSLNTIGPQRYSSIVAGSVNGIGGMYHWYNGYYFTQIDFNSGKARSYVRQFNPNAVRFMADMTFNNPNYGEQEWLLPERFRLPNRWVPFHRPELLLFISKFSESRFNLLLRLLNAPTQYFLGKQGPVSIRTSELLQWVESPSGCGLRHLRETLAKLLQTNNELPSEPETAEKLLDQYREKLKKAIGTARFYGLPDRPLEKVFVELTVIEDFEIPRDAEYKALMDKELRRRRTLFPKDETEEDETQRESRKVRRTVKPEELLEAGKRSQVVGAPGCGKTTLLRWLALQTAQTTDRLPVFIELKALKKAQFDTIDDDFSAFLFQQGVKRRFDSTDLTAEQFASFETVFHQYFNAGRLVVLLDGLDEIAESKRHRLRAAVENYANHHQGGLTLIVSTRPYGYLRNFADLKAMEIEPLSDIQIGQFLDHWCEKSTADSIKTSLRKNSNLRSLARFPFLLAFIARFKSSGGISPIELYQQIVSELVTKLDKDKGIYRFKIDDPDGRLKKTFLRTLSFERLFETRATDLTQRLVFSFEELVKRAEVFLRKRSRNSPSEDLAFDVCATPLLREVENGRYAFAHLTIQEFLAAEEFSRRDDLVEYLEQTLLSDQLITSFDVIPMTIALHQSNALQDLTKLVLKFPQGRDWIERADEFRKS